MSTCIATEGCKSGAVVGNVCVTHYDRLRQMLEELETEAAILSAVPSMQMRMDSGKGSLASERAPVRLDVLVHVDPRRGTGRSETEDDALAAGETLSILDVLHSWARIVREERNLTDSGAVTVTGERALWMRHLDWIVAQDWIDEAFSDIRQLAGQLKAANGHRAERPYSRCPVTTHTGTCTGAVWVRDELQPVWRRYPDRCQQTYEEAPGAAVCDTCQSVWATEAEKARLKRMVEDMAAEAARPHAEDGERMLTAEELVDKGYVTTTGNVRVKAHRMGVVSVRGHYDPRWFTDKATA